MQLASRFSIVHLAHVVVSPFLTRLLGRGRCRVRGTVPAPSQLGGHGCTGVASLRGSVTLRISYLVGFLCLL